MWARRAQRWASGGLLLAVGCAEGGGGGGGGGGKDEPDAAHDGVLRVLDQMSQAPLPSTEVVVDGVFLRGDGEGELALALEPDAVVVANIDRSNYLPTDIVLRGGAADAAPWTLDVALYAASLLTAFGDASEVPWDARKGILTVAVRDAAAGTEGLEGLTVTTDPPGGFAVVDAEAAQFGYAPGNTFQQRTSWVLFANLEPGLTAVAFDTPAGERCFLAPGGAFGPGLVPIREGVRTHVEVVCR